LKANFFTSENFQIYGMQEEISMTLICIWGFKKYTVTSIQFDSSFCRVILSWNSS